LFYILKGAQILGIKNKYTIILNCWPDLIEKSTIDTDCGLVRGNP
jgi:hypothetical protein